MKEADDRLRAKASDVLDKSEAHDHVFFLSLWKAQRGDVRLRMPPDPRSDPRDDPRFPPPPELFESQLADRTPTNLSLRMASLRGVPARHTSRLAATHFPELPGTETIQNQGSRAIIRQQTSRGPFSAVSMPIFATNIHVGGFFEIYSRSYRAKKTCEHFSSPEKKNIWRRGSPTPIRAP